MIGPGQPGMDDLMFDDPMLMQQLGLMQPQPMQQQDQSLPGDREQPRSEGWSLALIVSGIILMISWIAVPVGGLGAWVYGPIEGFLLNRFIQDLKHSCVEVCLSQLESWLLSSFNNHNQK